MADRASDTNPAGERGDPPRGPGRGDPSAPEADAPERSEEWVPAGGGPRVPEDPEVPEADALEQSEEWVPAGGSPRLPDDPEVPEADAWDQALEVPFDDEEPG